MKWTVMNRDDWDNLYFESDMDEKVPVEIEIKITKRL